MSAGLPLLLLSSLAILILVVWAVYGKGDRNKRLIIAAVALLLIVMCWTALLNFGVFHPIGAWGMALGYIFSFLALFVPIVWNNLN